MGRVAYHKELIKLEDDVYKMAAMVRAAIIGSVEALKARDIKASKKIMKDDKKINDIRYKIEENCLLLIATQQPMAVDLRIIAAILSIITDLERIADHAEGTASINVMIGKDEIVKPLEDIPQMAEFAVTMLDNCMKSFKNRDIKAAIAVCDEDDKVDDLYDRVYADLIQTMIKDPKKIEGATYLMWVAHNLERVADRVTNIAERVVFMVTGKIEELNVSKY